MPPPMDRKAIETQASQRVRDILRAAASWSQEAPRALQPGVRAVCIRLAEMVADQRHYLVPLPEPQESERRAVLALVAEQLRSAEQVRGIEDELAALSDLELKATGSWALVPTAQAEWITTAIHFLESCAARLGPEERPDRYWAEDVVAGVIASVKAVIGVDELHAKIEAQFSGPGKRVEPEGDVDR
jgi:hypothetical protein